MSQFPSNYVQSGLVQKTTSNQSKVPKAGISHATKPQKQSGLQASGPPTVGTTLRLVYDLGGVSVRWPNTEDKISTELSRYSVTVRYAIHSARTSLGRYIREAGLQWPGCIDSIRVRTTSGFAKRHPLKLPSTPGNGSIDVLSTSLWENFPLPNTWSNAAKLSYNIPDGVVEFVIDPNYYAPGPSATQAQLHASIPQIQLGPPPQEESPGYLNYPPISALRFGSSEIPNTQHVSRPPSPIHQPSRLGSPFVPQRRKTCYDTPPSGP